MTTRWDSPRPGRRGFPKKTARAILSNHPTCELQYPGCLQEATQVDHRVGWADAMALGWDEADLEDPTNAQPVCANCHTLKTQAEAQRGKARQKAQRARPGRRHPGLR